MQEIKYVFCVFICRFGKYDLHVLIRLELEKASWFIQFSKIFCLLNTRQYLKYGLSK